MSLGQQRRRDSSAINGPLLIQLRLRRGWTQRELAQKSGYSERLVSKAEGSGSLSRHALEVLAQTLSTPDEPVYPEDLVSDPESLARRLIAAYLRYQGEFPVYIREFVDDDILMWFAGDPQKMPFAGEHRGREAFEACWRTFFKFVEHREEKGCVYEPQWLASGNVVVAWGLDHSNPRDWPDAPPVSTTQRFIFRRGKLIEFHNFCDTEQASSLLAEARARRVLTGEL